MGWKSVCANCRKAFSQGIDTTKIKENKVCPNCGRIMGFFSEKFRPPKKTDQKKWEIVSILVECSINYKTGIGSFPKTIEEAQEFTRLVGNLYR